MKRVLITGGGGFVGSHIVKQLRKRDIDCVVFGRNPYPQVAAMGAECVQGDITDVSSLLLATKNVDTVFHVAALAGIWGKWDDYYRINVTGTGNVLTACRKNGVRNCIYTSTPSVVFNGEDIIKGDESLPYGKKVLCHYAKSKIMAEKLVLESNSQELSTCAIRPHLVWGPGDPHLIPRLLARGRKKELKKVGSCKNLVDISYVENVATAHLLAAENLEKTGTAAGKAYFISQGDPVNLWDWVDELFVNFNIPAIEKRVPFAVAYLAGAILEGVHTIFALEKEPKMTRFLAEQLAKSHCFSMENAKNDLGYIPQISTEEGMERMCEKGLM